MIKIIQIRFPSKATKNTFYKQFFLGPALKKKKVGGEKKDQDLVKPDLTWDLDIGNWINYAFARGLQGKKGDPLIRPSSKYFSNKITNCILTAL